MKNKATEIKLTDYFTEKVNSRSVVRMVAENFSDSKSVMLDFENIDFISRAAAHELVTSLEKLQTEGKTVSLQHVHPNVDKMIQAVSASRAIDFKKATFVQRLSFDSEKELDKFLMAI
jgi:anti-anti-sigma regulatory factor